MKRYVIALDQGTTSSRAIIFDDRQHIVAQDQKEFAQHYPEAGYVEHDPMEIYSTQYGVMAGAMKRAGVRPEEVCAIGITNQRETAIVWDRETGKPVYNAIVWQCRRTASICEEMKRDGLEPYVREATGLVIDAYFSGTKIKWILDHVDGARALAEQGRLLFGTVDTWLIWNLTGGKAHVTDYTNASRTLLFDIRNLCWDETLCRYLGIPMSMLPEVRSSSEIYGYANLEGVEIPIAGCAGDQQAALFGQACFRAGEAKNTYGTGCFLLLNTGETLCRSQNGLLTTLAAGTGKGACYALEGSVFVAGAVVQWLRDELKLIERSEESEARARAVEDNGGVYVVPAFVGLGAPYWDMYARGAILGLTRGANRDHIIRAALESIAYQTHDVVEAMRRDTGLAIAELRVDGGASANDFLMQFQADILDASISRPVIRETTALGAAYLAGLATGMWDSMEEIRSQWTLERKFEPAMDHAVRGANLRGWSKAVGRARSWVEEQE